MSFTHIQLKTNRQFEIVDITTQVQTAVTGSGVQTGVVLVSVPHTTAAIRVNHAEPLLLQDMVRTLYRIVPHDTSYNHDQYESLNGGHPKDHTHGHAHIKAFLLGNSASVPISGGSLVLGDKQSILLVECSGPKTRTVHISCIGNA